MTVTANMTGITRTRYIGTTEAVSVALSTFQAYLRSDLEDVFFNTTEFATSCSYSHYQGTTETYSLISDDPTQEISPGSKTEIMMQKPFIKLPKHVMVKGLNLKDTILYKGITYKIDSYEDDGVGVLTIHLAVKVHN